jgi:hypothetical protein
MGGASGKYGGEKRCIQGLVGKPDGKRPFGTPKCRWGITLKHYYKKWDRGRHGLD